MTNDSLIEKLEALKQQWGNHPDPCAVIDDIIAVVRQHQAEQPDCGEIPSTSLTALEALTFLVSLKAHKDQFGKTPYYEMWQPRAWERAIKALGNESIRQPEPVSGAVWRGALALHDLNAGHLKHADQEAIWLRDRDALQIKAKTVLDAAGVKYVD